MIHIYTDGSAKACAFIVTDKNKDEQRHEIYRLRSDNNKTVNHSELLGILGAMRCPLLDG